MFAEQADAEVGEIERSNAEVIETRGLPTPEKPVGLLPSPTTVSPLEFDQKSYDKSVFDRVLQQITADKAVNVTSIFAKAKKDIPELKRKQVLMFLSLHRLSRRPYSSRREAPLMLQPTRTS